MTDDTDSVFHNFQQAASATTQISQAVTEHASDGSRQIATYLAIGCVSGALNVLSLIVGAAKDEPRDGSKTPKDCNICERINADTLLFSAILAALAVRNTKGFNRDGQTGCAGTVEFGPSVILEALQMVERATGIKADDKLAPGMVEVARNLEASGGALVDGFFAERRKKMN